MFDILNVGIIVADVIVKPVDNLPDRGKLKLTESIQLHTGGCAVNSAIDLSKIGLNTAVIGKVGNDDLGEYMLDSMRKMNVNTNGIKVDPTAGTSASIAIVNSDGERSFIHSFGADAMFEENDVDYEIVENSKIIFVGGAMLLPKFDGLPCSRMLEKAKKMGKITALDTTWDSTGQWMNLLKPCMPYIDYFMPSYEEAVQLSGKTEPEQIADVFLQMGVKNAVIKLGKKGCLIKNYIGEKYNVPAFKGLVPVDTTGAGNAFTAGFLTGLIKGWDLYECGIFANATGAHCIMAVGASAGIKSFDDIMSFINKNRPEV